jgi:hypothetical protein
MATIIIEFQHFHGCPNGPILLGRVQDAISSSSRETEFIEVIIDTPEKAAKIGFLGSPTVLINGKDVEEQERLDKPNLSCRFYPNGLPTVEQIKAKLDEQP